jgi:hypothetical protein
MDLKMYINSGFLGQISKKYESHIAKTHFLDIVQVWLSLADALHEVLSYRLVQRISLR